MRRHSRDYESDVNANVLDEQNDGRRGILQFSIRRINRAGYQILMIAKRISTVALLAFAGGALFFAAFLASSALEKQDFAAFWSASHLVSQNPYSLQAVATFERSHGVIGSEPAIVMKNPPWTLLFLLPLSCFNYGNAFALWAVFEVVAILGCALATWNLYSRPSSAALFLPLCFGPTIVLLMLGQLDALVLIGITLFLVMAERKQDWIAGASTLLILTKPHVVVLFLLALVLWTIQSRRWTILWSSLLAIAASSSVVLAINPRIFAEFLERTREYGAETQRYPNLGGIIDRIPGTHVLGFLPMLIGLIWLLFFWRENRLTWDWKKEGMIVLILSVACSYYSFSYDEILVLPALIAAFATGNRRVFLVCFLATNIGYALYFFNFAGHFGFNYMFLAWTGSGWAITFVAALWPRLREPAAVFNKV